MITIHSHTEITIRRPSGEIEVVRHPAALNAGLFARAKAANLAAGTGECLSYKLITKQVAEPEGYAEAIAAERAYDQHRAAVYRAMDARTEAEAVDRTPAHQDDR